MSHKYLYLLQVSRQTLVTLAVQSVVLHGPEESVPLELIKNTDIIDVQAHCTPSMLESAF